MSKTEIENSKAIIGMKKDMEYMRTISDQILVQVKETNGRISKLETWRDRILYAGGGAGAFLGFPKLYALLLSVI